MSDTASERALERSTVSRMSELPTRNARNADAFVALDCIARVAVTNPEGSPSDKRCFHRTSEAPAPYWALAKATRSMQCIA
eukprot:7064801-Prymnesium_polylepis.1